MFPKSDFLTVPAIENLTRRGFLSSALAAAFVIACGDDDDEGSTVLTTKTRTITHEFGTFEVPLAPERVVALDGRPGFEAVLALGFKPIAIGQDAVVSGKLAPFIDFDNTNVPLINPNQVDFEALLRLQPDLIIGRDFQIEAQLDQLKVAAPVLPIRIDDHWRVALTRFADWLERRPQVDARLAKYDEALAALKKKHATRIAGAKVGTIEFGVSDLNFYRNTRYVHLSTLKDIGGREHPFLAGLTGDKFSLEQIEQLDDIDAVLVVGFGDAYEQLKQHAIWQRLPAVAAGRVVSTDIRTNYGGLYAATGCLDLWDRVYSTLA